MAELPGQMCMMCGEKKATLHEEEIDVPHFGKTFVFGIFCNGCGYRKNDLEVSEKKQPMQYALEINSEDDMSIKVVKSSEATLKIPRIITMESGPASNGFITNVEGVLERIKKIIESAAESEDDSDAKKKARKMIKKINNVILGRDKLKLIVSDPSGNSAIISDKATKKKL